MKYQLPCAFNPARIQQKNPAERWAFQPEFALTGNFCQIPTKYFELPIVFEDERVAG
jgi:hypothetical protein